MNGRPEGPSPALLAAQRRLEEARNSYQLSVPVCRPRAASREQAAIGSTWPVENDRPVAADRPPASTLSFHPSIALAMLKTGLAAPGRIWLLSRYLDQNGRGWLDLDQAQQRLCHKESDLRVCGRRQLRNLLRQGQGIFWHRDKSRVWLRSAARVAIALDVDRLRGRPVKLPVDALLGGMGQVRAHLYATFHSGRRRDNQAGPGNPINRETLRKITHVPARTQRLYEQRAGVEVRSNMAVGERLTESNLQERAWRHGRATFPFIDRQGKQGPAGGRYVAWRLPNSYQGPHALSPKGRMKKINHQIDLVNSRAQGNDLGQASARRTVDRLFHSSGRDAGLAYNRDQSRDIYWPASARRLWRVLPARRG
jgi:hypothetical protein